MKKTTFNCELASICIDVRSVCYVFTNKKVVFQVVVQLQHSKMLRHASLF